MISETQTPASNRCRAARSTVSGVLAAVILVAGAGGSMIDRDGGETARITVRQVSFDLSRFHPHQFADWDTSVTR